MCQQGNYRSRARHTFRRWGMHKAVELRAEKAEGVAEGVAGVVAEEEGSSSCMSHRSWNRNYGHILPTPPIHK